MKKIATLILVGLLAGFVTNAQSFDDDFEAYLVGSKLGPQSTTWTTWSLNDAAAEDVTVVTTDNHTVGGTKSVYFSSTSASGGPQDVVLPFGGVRTSGIFTFSSWFKVPVGKTAYFNFQGGATIAATGNIYALDCYMNANGTIDFQNGTTSKLLTDYPQGAWFELKIIANLSTNNWSVLIDDTLRGSFASTVNKVSFLDLYPANAQAQFWVDDIHYDLAPYTLPLLNGAVSILNVSSSVLNISKGFAGQTSTPSVIVKNSGTTPITSFDLEFNDNGLVSTQNFTGLNIASLATYTVAIPSVAILNGSNTFSASISNVNGVAVDDDTLDDSKSTTFTFTPSTPAVGKMVVGEEVTGTWCGWCPRGAVFMDALTSKYDGYFVPIAVHNADPMTHTAYDAAIGALIAGYPSALVDRQPEVDPSAMETGFLTRVTLAPKAFLVNGASYDSTTRELNVSVTTTIQQSITGNYKIAFVLTEDEVTGTSGTYAQTNYYSGGAEGPMGGYESLGDPVPAAQMVYDHVARAINPNFAGAANAFGTSAGPGQIFTYNHSYILPSTWDESKIHIIGLFIEPTGRINNASSATIAEAVSNGFVAGTDLSGVGMADIDSPDEEVKLYPNPASRQATLSLNLEKTSTVEVSIYQINGTLVETKNYGQLSGGVQIPVGMADFEAGLYFVKVSVDGKITTLKLIKE